MNLRHLAAIVATAALTSLAACATMAAKPIAPDVSLQSIDSMVATPDGARARLTLRVRNPNDFDVAVKALDYRLVVDGDNASSGAVAQPVTLPAGATTPVAIDVRIDLRVMGRALDHAFRTGRLPYKVSGTLTTADGLWLPFHHDDAIELPRIDVKP
jgi:LEA14-like dessication related protein